MCAQRPSAGVAATRHPSGTGVGEEDGEALRELREEEAWSAWVEEGGNSGGAGLYCCCGCGRDREMGG
jgi:hypothetical protein